MQHNVRNLFLTDTPSERKHKNFTLSIYEKQQDMPGIYRDLIYAVLIRQCVKLEDNDRCS